jgi:hypothetical protein
MKLILKFVLYSVIIVSLVIGSLLFFKGHPDVQLAFLLPGIFIAVFSKIADDIYVKDRMRLRIAKGR